MLRKIYKILLVYGFVGIGAAAAIAQTMAHEDIIIKVNGMVCDFCAQSVWKVFKDYDAVNDVDIDLDSGTVTVHLKPDQALDDAAVDKAIIYAGYELVGVTRSQHEG